MKKGIALLLIVLSLGLSSALKAGTPMKGSYIVDPKGKTPGTKFLSLPAAMSSLKSNGTSGKVTFLLTSDSFPALKISQNPIMDTIAICRLSAKGKVYIKSIYDSGLKILILDTINLDYVSGYNCKLVARSCSTYMGGTDVTCLAINSNIGGIYGGNNIMYIADKCNIGNIYQSPNGTGQTIKVYNSQISGSVYCKGTGGLQDNWGSKWLVFYDSMIIHKSNIKGKVLFENAIGYFENDTILSDIQLDTAGCGFYKCVIKNGLKGTRDWISLFGNYIYGPVNLDLDEDGVAAYIDHNTIVSNSATTLKVKLSANSYYTIDITDNILVNYNHEPAFNYSGYGFYNAHEVVSNLALYSNGTDTVLCNSCGGKSSISCAKKLNSICLLPTFKSSTDLHCTDPRVYSKAKYSFTDMDGDNGQSIGADNFNVILNDAGITSLISPIYNVCSGIRPVEVKLKNKGFYALTSVTFNWLLNGKLQSPFSWTGNLAYDSSVSVVIGTQFFSAGSQILKIWTSLPNNKVDGNAFNDTIVTNFSVQAKPNPSISGHGLSYLGEVLIYQTSKVPGTSYLWKTSGGTIISGLGTDSILFMWAYPKNQTIKLVETNTAGCKDSALLNVFVDSAPVWPGDANRDKIINNNDLLNIGLGFGRHGRARPSASSGWFAQASWDWKDTFTSKINYKHADCNGDSLISYDDTVVVRLNYSRVHPKTFTSTQGAITDPPLILAIVNDSAMGGDLVKAEILFGDRNISAKNVYGLAFSIIYPSAFVDTAFAFFGTSWLSPQKLSIAHIASPGRLDLAVVRTNHTDTSGAGRLATVYFKLNKYLPSVSSLFKITIAENTQINAKGQYKPVYMQSDSIMVKQTFTGIAKQETYNSAAVTLYPNPANTELLIRFSEAMPVTLNLKDMTGKEISIPQYINGKEYKMNISSLPSGIYFLNISSEQSVISKKIVIQH